MAKLMLPLKIARVTNSSLCCIEDAEGGLVAGECWNFHASEIVRAVNNHDALVKELKDCENVLADYIPTLEAQGAVLNYGRKVIFTTRALLAAIEKDAGL